MMTLHRALEQALSNNAWPDNRVWVPAIAVVEQKDSYLMYADLPGVDPSQIEITFEQNVLTIRGAKPSNEQTSNDGEVRVYAAEHATGPVDRAIRLPEFVDGDHIAAEFNNGLLKVQVPKAAAQPRRIEIKPTPRAPAELSNGSPAEISNN